MDKLYHKQPGNGHKHREIGVRTTLDTYGSSARISGLFPHAFLSLPIDFRWPMADALTPNTLAVSFELIPAIFFNKWILLARGMKESYQTPNRL